MQKHFVIGASGLIGQELFKELTKQNCCVFGTYSSQKKVNLHYFNLFDNDWSFFEALTPNDIVYVMSAYSDPTWISRNRALAQELNLTKTKQLIDAVLEKGAKVIFMSSVEVFDGEKGYYCEEDAVNPLNFYGEMKAQIEEYLRETAGSYIIVRTGWNVGFNRTSRCVVALTYETIKRAGAKMATDNFFSIAHVSDTALGLSRLKNNFDSNKIHLCCANPVNRFSLASLIKEKSTKCHEMSFSPCNFSDLDYSEPRGRLNDLSNVLSVRKLGIKYHDADALIAKKVKYLDEVC